MSTKHLLRLASRNSSIPFIRAPSITRRTPLLPAAPSGLVTCGSFSTTARRTADKDGQEAADHHEESFDEFTARYGYSSCVCLLIGENSSV